MSSARPCPRLMRGLSCGVSFAATEPAAAAPAEAAPAPAEVAISGDPAPAEGEDNEVAGPGECVNRVAQPSCLPAPTSHSQSVLMCATIGIERCNCTSPRMPFDCACVCVTVIECMCGACSQWTHWWQMLSSHAQRCLGTKRVCLIWTGQTPASACKKPCL